LDPKNNIPSKTPNLRRLFGRLALLVGEKIELGMPMDVVFLEKKPVYTPTRFIYTANHWFEMNPNGSWMITEVCKLLAGSIIRMGRPRVASFKF